MANFATIISSNGGFKAAKPATKLTFKQISASLLVDNTDDLPSIMAEVGILNGETNEAPKDFAEAQQLLIETFAIVAKMEDEQMLLEPELRDASYNEWKQALEEVRNKAGITIVVRGEHEVDGKTQRVTVYINPERSFEDGNTRKAGRFNTRILFENGILVTAFGSTKTDAKRGLVINAFGCGPHREENDPINLAREARRASLATA